MRVTRIECGEIPVRATLGAAGLDLRARTSGALAPGFRDFVPCGVACEIPYDYVGLVCSRSGLALSHGVVVLNAPGVVDRDYRGEIGALLINLGQETWRWQIGDRVAQLVLVVAHYGQVIEVEQLITTKRGTNGFGSTGVK